MSLVAAAAVAGAGSASAVSDFKFQRIGGTDRYETSTLVADEFANTNTDVILANGEPGNYADALSANTLAGEMSVPVLLTRKDKTPDTVLQQLVDDKVKTITVVGGETVVSAAQVADLESKGYTVNRVSGSDRFATNAEIIKDSGAAVGNTGLIATGFNFPDALAAGPISYVGHPLGLTAKDNIEDSVVNALKGAGVDKVLIFGGETAVAPAVVAKLAANGITVTKRFAGTDRSDTSVQAAEYAVSTLGFTNKHVGVASGYVDGFGADALAGGPLEGKEKSPMLVTRDVNNPDNALDYLKNHANTLEDGHLYGGPAAISTSAQDAMEKAAQSTTTNQEYTVSGGAAKAVTDDILQYTVTGITAGKVDIVLAKADQVTNNTNSGQVTFAGTNPGGSGNQATLTAADSVITVVNGTDVADGNPQDNITVTGGTLTFTVKVGTRDFVPVVFADEADDDTLSLNADGTPSEDFGVGQTTTVVPPEQSTGVITPNQVVTSTDQAGDSFVTDAGKTYNYDSNDLFTVSTDNGATYKTVTMAQFEAALSPDDVLNGTFYQSDSANQSSFALNDKAPAAPANVDAAAPGTTVAANDGKAGIEVTWDNSATDSVASYNVYRATAIQPSITGQPVTCPTASSAFTKIGSVADKDASTTTTYSYLDSTATPPATTGSGDPSYCYYVTSVDKTGQESGPSNTAGPQEASKASPAPSAAAPKFVDAVTNAVSISGGKVKATVTYSETIDDATLDNDYTVVLTQGSTSWSLANVTVDSVTADDELVDIYGDEPGGTFDNTEPYSVVVTAKTGTDTNTVGDNSTPQQFQAVGDQLFIPSA